MTAVEAFKGADFYVPSYRLLVGETELNREIHDVISVSYTDSLQDIDSFDLVLNNWNDGASKLDSSAFKYSDESTFEPWKDVELHMGYIRLGRDERVRMLTGEITTFAPDFPQSSPSTLSVRGLNLFHRFRTKQITRPFFRRKDSDIAKLLVKEIASEVQTCMPQLELVLDPDDYSSNIESEQEIEYLVLNNQYPIVFLLERARRIGYELAMEEETSGSKRKVTFHYRPTNEVLESTYVLEWGKSLMSFQPTLQTANQVSEVVVRGWDPNTKDKIEEKATRSDLVGEGVVAPSDLAVKESSLAQKLEVVVDRPIHDKEEAKNLATRTLRQLAQGLVVAKGKTVGLPALRAGVKVDCLALGRFSGTYLVTSTTHSIGAQGYTTSFTARMEHKLKENP